MTADVTSYEKMSVQTAGTLLEGEYCLYSLLGGIFLNTPEKDFLGSLADNRLFDDMPFGTENPEMKECFVQLQTWNDSCAHPFSDEDLEALSLDYTRLFVGLSKVPAPPWESVYFNRERMVFQQQTMDVRQWYRRYHLQVESYQHEPDDHMGSELLFVGHLSRLAKEAFENGAIEEGRELLCDQTRFITEHPGRWGERWADLIADTAQSRFYVACSQLTCTALKETLDLNDHLSNRKGPY